MNATKELSQEAQLAIGALMAVSFAVLFVLSFRRFDWLQRHLPAVLRWGFPHLWTYPATRYGLCSGCLVGFAIGVSVIVTHFDLMDRATGSLLLRAVFLNCVIAAIHDFKVYRKAKNRRSEERGART